MVARLKRGGIKLAVSLAKVALVLAVLGSSGLVLESATELAECEDVELAPPAESESRLACHSSLKSTATGRSRGEHGPRAWRRLELARLCAHADGHRLANGLLAPSLC